MARAFYADRSKNHELMKCSAAKAWQRRCQTGIGSDGHKK